MPPNPKLFIDAIDYPEVTITCPLTVEPLSEEGISVHDYLDSNEEILNHRGGWVKFITEIEYES